MARALVLGGGGTPGIAWEYGVLEGLRREGVDLTGADSIIGTSAGAVVGTRIAVDALETAYNEQTRPPTHELPSSLSRSTQLRLGIMLARPGHEDAKWRRVGKAARDAHPESGDARREVIRSRIGDPAWPDQDLRVTAVDVDRGEFVVFDSASGISLLDAVTASCAVPLIYPPVPIDGTTYVDGGVRSPANADLARGADCVIVLAPLVDAPVRTHALDRQLERTGARRTLLICPDGARRGSTGLPSQREEAVAVGLRQGKALASEVADTWD